MAVDVIMPNLGFESKTARLIAWLKPPGSPVSKGEAIAVIESDKANVELEAIAEGVLLEQRVLAGEDVPIGAIIARIGHREEEGLVDDAPSAREPGARRASPLARRMAHHLGVAIDQLEGSGTRGRVTRQDVQQAFSLQTVNVEQGDVRGIRALPRVRREARRRGIDLRAVQAAGFPDPISIEMLEAFAESRRPISLSQPPQPDVEQDTPSSDDVRAIPLSKARQMIGRRLRASMQDAPHFYMTSEMIFDGALRWLDDQPERVTINDLLAYLTVQALLRVPALSRTFDGETLYEHSGVHLAIAVARAEDVITPVIRHAERLSLIGIARASRDLIARARADRPSAADLGGGTFTLSNMGIIRQIDHFTAVINPPQVAILAVGALRPRPVVIDGGLFVRQTAHLTLSGDHRVVDGAHLGAFMAAFAEVLDQMVHQKKGQP
jgi:pyruvate dehydrogenase E2 component (dihydrolipoamide acetyltransferase)